MEFSSTCLRAKYTEPKRALIFSIRNEHGTLTPTTLFFRKAVTSSFVALAMSLAGPEAEDPGPTACSSFEAVIL